MSGMAAGATGNPEALEQPSQNVAAAKRDNVEDKPQLKVLRQRRVQPEDREDQDLRDDGDPVAHDHIGQCLDQ
jgi:hypothetical protein